MTNKTLREVDQEIRLIALKNLRESFGFRWMVKPLTSLFINSAADPKEEPPELGSTVGEEPSPK